jgi:phenylalanyl-tRNA synthetase beta chain
VKISLEWLKDYIKLNDDTASIINLLTFSGIEVEDHFAYGDLPDSVITAKIVDCRQVEGSDHLKECQVDTGQDILQVVCGAPNCTKDSVVILAQIGTKIGGLVIKKTKIKGIESSGMLCSEKELGLSEDHRGIINLPGNTPIGIPLGQLFQLPDQVFELEITPNRPDLLGYQGIAKDLAASSGSLLNIPDSNNVAQLEKDNPVIGDYLSLENRVPDLCSRYVARVFLDVTVSESPFWLKLRLLKSGLRPINNIVDITNYIMLETGHPLHAFDYDKLESQKSRKEIIVRRAKQGEVFPALDGETYCLNSDNLVIADGNKPVALAGVIGGLNSHITDQTRNIVLESACFNHTNVRRTSYQYKIQTDSSYRFERQMAPDTCEYASLRASKLITELASGTICRGTLDDWQNRENDKIVALRPARYAHVIGKGLDKKKIVGYLSTLGLTYLGEGTYKKNFPASSKAIPKIVRDQNKILYSEVKPHRNTKIDVVEPLEEALYFSIPPNRVDLTREIDLIEEVSRLFGMDNVPHKTAVSLIMDRQLHDLKRKTADYLIYNGLQEVINLSFTDPELVNELRLAEEDIRLNQIALLNPQNSNLSVMRTTLIPQLLSTALFNLNHGAQKLRIFELNKVFLENNTLPKSEQLRLSILMLGDSQDSCWKNKHAGYDFYDLKGLVFDLLHTLNISETVLSSEVSGYFIRTEAQSVKSSNQQICEFGKLNPAIAARFNIDTAELKRDIWIADIDLFAILELTRRHEYTYQSPPRFPSIERDVSFLIKQGISHQEIFDNIKQTNQQIVQDVLLLDEYKGKQVPADLRSLTYRIIFNHSEKTLTDEEVDASIDFIIKNMKILWDIQTR